MIFCLFYPYKKNPPDFRRTLKKETFIKTILNFR